MTIGVSTQPNGQPGASGGWRSRPRAGATLGAVLAAVTLAGLLAALAACGGLQAPAAPLVLYLSASPAEEDRGYPRFAQALAQQAAAQGLAYRLQHRHAAVGETAMAAAVRDALALRPALIVASSGDHATAAFRERAAAGLEREVPIVFSSLPDPVQRGFVNSLERPGRNITGVTFQDRVHAKRLELLRDAFPAVRRVGVLLDRSYTAQVDFARELAAPGRSLGLQLIAFVADDAAELQTAWALAEALSVQGWYIPPTWFAYTDEALIRDGLRQRQRPAIHVTDGEVARGALLAYEQQSGFAYPAMAELSLRVLRGEDAGAIPVQRPWRFVLSVRPRDEPVALHIDASVVRRADRVH